MSEIGFDVRVTMKLLRYLAEGNTVYINGFPYIWLDLEAEGGSNAEAVLVNKMRWGEIHELAQSLSGIEKNKVMNHKRKKS